MWAQATMENTPGVTSCSLGSGGLQGGCLNAHMLPGTSDPTHAAALGLWFLT